MLTEHEEEATNSESKLDDVEKGNPKLELPQVCYSLNIRFTYFNWNELLGNHHRQG